MEIGGVDTTRARGQLMLYTPAFHADTRTAPGGLEWALEGNPLRVVGQPHTAGSTPIPPNGFVLSFGGSRAPPALASVRSGTRIDLRAIYSPVEGGVEAWALADDIIGGAGLLVRDGQLVKDWSIEQLGRGFVETRHPRTLIGTHHDGSAR